VTADFHYSAISANGFVANERFALRLEIIGLRHFGEGHGHSRRDDPQDSYEGIFYRKCTFPSGRCRI
jgi:hypothetical protein